MQRAGNEPAVFGIHYKEDDYYHGGQPGFIDTAEFGWVKEVETQWKIMRDEIVSFLGSGGELKKFTSPTSPGLSYPDAWKKIYFMNSGWLQPANCKKLPKTWNIIRQIPGVTMGAVLILEPNGSILPHSSESNINIRCHLGIKIPAGLPQCGIEIKGEKRGWEEGKVIMFNDCHRHMVWNETSDSRVVVAFDILQPRFANRRTWYCALYLGALSVRSLDVYIPLKKYLPGSLMKIFHYPVSLGWYVYLQMQSVIVPGVL